MIYDKVINCVIMSCPDGVAIFTNKNDNLFLFCTGDQKTPEHQSDEPSPKMNKSTVTKQKPQAIFSLFTSTPVSSRHRTPIFKPKDFRKSTDHNSASLAGTKDTGFLPEESERPLEINDITEIAPELPPQPNALSPVKSQSNCLSNQDMSAATSEQTEDETMFYTPELFEEEDEREPEQLTIINKSSCVQAEIIETICNINPKEAVGDNSNSCVPSQSVAEQASYSTGGRDRTQQHQRISNSRRLSRSRQKAPSKAEGKLTAYFTSLSQTSQL